MPAPSTVIVPLADALKTLLEGLDFAPAVKAYRWAPSQLATGTAAVIDIPEVRRTGVDEPEEQLGSDDWTITFPVELLVDLAVAETATRLGSSSCSRRSSPPSTPTRRSGSRSSTTPRSSPAHPASTCLTKHARCSPTTAKSRCSCGSRPPDHHRPRRAR
jgi:hypothetical protein